MRIIRMFGSFTSLFQGGGAQKETAWDAVFHSQPLESDFPVAVYQKESATSLIPLLTESSPCKKAPSTCAVPLWPHQEAMLTRCLEIEANPAYAQTVYKNSKRYWDKTKMITVPPVKIGVLNDPPGSGKTYALLALLATDTIQRGLNILCVPQNIFAQWQKALETMFPQQSIPFKCINNYIDVTSFYGDPNVFKQYSILLVNDAYMETLATTLNDTKTAVHRLVIDEIDSVQDRFYTPIAAEHVWLISASFVHKETKSVGPYSFQSNDIPRIFCKCDAAFVSKHVKLPAPTTEIVSCEDSEIQLVRDIVSIESLTSLNAMNEKPLQRELGVPPGPVPSMVYAYIQRLRLESAKLEDYEKELAFGTNDAVLKEQYRIHIDRFQKLRNKANTLETRLQTHTSSAETKWDVLERVFLPRMVSGTKWLVFNDNAETLYRVEQLLKKRGISCCMLDGGSVEEIDKTLHAYSHGDLQVLLLNSKLEGAGMNLEQTTHLLFLHATHERLVEQVVGRAQRFGRSCPLHIIGLFYKNEEEEIRRGSLKDLTAVCSAEA